MVTAALDALLVEADRAVCNYAEHPRSYDRECVLSRLAARLAAALRNLLAERDTLNDQIRSARVFVSSDADAITYQSLGQYRTALLQMLSTQSPPPTEAK